MATDTEVYIIVAAVAASLRPATGVLIIAATTASGISRTLRVLPLDLVPFAIVCVVCCAGSPLVYMLCVYMEFTACHPLLFSAFLSPVT